MKLVKIIGLIASFISFFTLISCFNSVTESNWIYGNLVKPMNNNVKKIDIIKNSYFSLSDEKYG